MLLGDLPATGGRPVFRPEPPPPPSYMEDANHPANCWHCMGAGMVFDSKYGPHTRCRSSQCQSRADGHCQACGFHECECVVVGADYAVDIKGPATFRVPRTELTIDDMVRLAKEGWLNLEEVEKVEDALREPCNHNIVDKATTIAFIHRGSLGTSEVECRTCKRTLRVGDCDLAHYDAGIVSPLQWSILKNLGIGT